MTLLQQLLVKIMIYVGVAIVACLGGFRMGYVYDHRAFVAYKEEVRADAARADEQRAQVALQNTQHQKEVDDEAATKLADAQRHIDDLLGKLRRAAPPARVPTAGSAAGTQAPADKSLGQIAAGNDRCAAGEESGWTAEDDALLDSLIAQQLWRQYAHDTGQDKE